MENYIYRNKAFTFIEIIIVMVIILLLVAMIITPFKNSVNSAYKVSCMSNIRSIIKAMHLYIEDFDGANIPMFGSVNEIYGAL